MKLKFTKMHGIGNDYIYFDATKEEIDNPSELAVKLSDRRFGIGGDGAILICKSDIADAKMRMFNADGSEGKMCGNGIRCVGKYIYDNDMVDKNAEFITVETLSGVKTLKVYEKNGKADMLRVDMGKAILTPKDIPIAYDAECVVSQPLVVSGKEYLVTAVSMGNPHCVVFVDDPDNIEIEKIGPCFEHHSAFPEGVNTEFVKVIDDHTLKMRVWERGSGETYACGTGACAAAVAAALNGYTKKGEDITVKLKGGDLVINYSDATVFMTGSATKVFDGEIEV